MADNPNRERGAQEESPGEREAKRAQTMRQDPSRPEEGRDVPPEREVVAGKRTRKSPWMGGG